MTSSTLDSSSRSACFVRIDGGGLFEPSSFACELSFVVCGLKRANGTCCSVHRAHSSNSCTPADEQYAEEQHKAWRSSLASTAHNHGTFPSNYKSLVIKRFSEVLKDPYSAKYGRFSRPRKEHAIEDVSLERAVFGWSTCVDVNAKNSFGAYTGNTTFWFLIVDDKIVRSSEVTGGDEIYIGRPINCADGP